MLATSSPLLATCEHPYEYVTDPDFYVDPEAYLFAFDLDSGRELARVELPSNAYGNPMTYVVDDRQYVVVPIGHRCQVAGLVGLAIPRLVRLNRLLSKDEKLIHARGYLDGHYEHSFFSGATLLHHVAGNPIRAELQPNVVEIALALIPAGADPKAVTIHSLSTLNLVVDGDQPRWLGVAGYAIAAAPPCKRLRGAAWLR